MNRHVPGLLVAIVGLALVAWVIHALKLPGIAQAGVLLALVLLFVPGDRLFYLWLIGTLVLAAGQPEPWRSGLTGAHFVAIVVADVLFWIGLKRFVFTRWESSTPAQRAAVRRQFDGRR